MPLGRTGSKGHQLIELKHRLKYRLLAMVDAKFGLSMTQHDQFSGNMLQKRCAL